MAQSKFARGLKGLVTGAGKIVARATGAAPARPVQPARIPAQAGPGPWFSVTSSNVKAVRQNGPDLEVVFLGKGRRPDSTYVYRGAAMEIGNMLSAGSKGQFVHYRLKPLYHADGPF
jgi:hypothetical protein